MPLTASIYITGKLTLRVHHRSFQSHASTISCLIKLALCGSMADCCGMHCWNLIYISIRHLALGWRWWIHKLIYCVNLVKHHVIGCAWLMGTPHQYYHQKALLPELAPMCWSRYLTLSHSTVILWYKSAFCNLLVHMCAHVRGFHLRFCDVVLVVILEVCELWSSFAFKHSSSPPPL